MLPDSSLLSFSRAAIFDENDQLVVANIAFVSFDPFFSSSTLGGTRLDNGVALTKGESEELEPTAAEAGAIKAECAAAKWPHSAKLPKHASSRPDELKDADPETLFELRDRAGDLLMIWGGADPHVPPEGRETIREGLDAAGTRYAFSTYDGAEHAFMRDEGPRYDPQATDGAFAETIAHFARVFGA